MLSLPALQVYWLVMCRGRFILFIQVWYIEVFSFYITTHYIKLKKRLILPKYWHFFFLNTVEYFQDYSRMVLFRKTDVFCILWLKVWQLRLYYFWRRLLIPIHSTLRVWYDISNFPSILLPLLYFTKGQ